METELSLQLNPKPSSQTADTLGQDSGCDIDVVQREEAPTVFRDPVFKQTLPTPVLAQSLKSMLFNYDPVLRKVLVDGFLFGFDLGYRGIPNSDMKVENLISCLDDPEVVSQSIKKEIDAGRFMGPLDKLPFNEFQLNPVGLVPKKTPGEFRMFTHLSSPRGSSVNDGILEEFVQVSYASLEDALKLICHCGPSPFLAKLNIKHAYRLLPIKPSQYGLLCFQWEGKFFTDRCLPKGVRSSGQIFERFTTALHFLAERVGVQWLVHYLDNFLLMSNSYQSCVEAMNLFIGLCQELDIPLAVEQTLGPLQCLKYQGYLIDSLNAEIRLPVDELQQCRDLIKGMLGRKRVKSKKVQLLADLLQFACGVVVPGRPFLGRLYDMISGKYNPEFSVRLTAEVKKDLEVWQKFLNQFNGASIYKEQMFLSPQVHHIYTDASTSSGCGGVFGKFWFYVAWPTEWWTSQKTILLEIVPIYLALKAWASLLKNKYVILHTNNQALSISMNKMTSREPVVMSVIRLIVSLQLSFNINSRTDFIPGFLNNMSDALSHLQISEFRRLHPEANEVPSEVSLPDLFH